MLSLGVGNAVQDGGSDIRGSLLSGGMGRGLEEMKIGGTGSMAGGPVTISGGLEMNGESVHGVLGGNEGGSNSTMLGSRGDVGGAGESVMRLPQRARA